MGKASKWFRALLGLKTTHNQPKKKWSFASKSHNKEVKDRRQTPQAVVFPGGDDESSKHAIAVAAATAAAADAAVASAHAAAAVVHLTGSGRSASKGGCRGARYRSRVEWAAVVVQSHFRAYLSRRALRALKALVKLQALVRGYLVRKQTTYALQRLKALVRAQIRARAGRAPISDSPNSSTKSGHFNCPGPPTPEKFEHAIRARTVKHDQLTTPLKRNSSKSNSRLGERSFTTTLLPTDNDRITDKILEVDTGNYYNPLTTSKRRSLLFHSAHSDPNCRSFSTSTAHQSAQSPSSGEVQSLSPFCTAENSPTFYSAASSKRAGPFTPTKSDGSVRSSCLSGCSDHPNYMAYTASAKAKARSISAPKQRPNFERLGSTKRYSVHGLRAHVFASKAYPGSGRLDRMGMPVRGEGFNGGPWQGY